MDQNKLKALAIYSAIVTVVLVGQLFGTYCLIDTYEARQASVESYIPTIAQLQQALIDTGNPRYDVGPKGADGNPGTDTLRGWKNYSFDIYANGEPK